METASITPRPGLKPSSELPPPPELSPNPLSVSASLPGYQLCCLARARYEPVKPSRWDRVLRKVPGLRRLRRSPDETEGFSPPRPAHPIILTLPPGSLPSGAASRDVELKATVDESGAVTQVELLSPKDESLVDMAASAAGAWRFVPARLNDKAIPSQVLLRFQFDGE